MHIGSISTSRRARATLVLSMLLFWMPCASEAAGPGAIDSQPIAPPTRRGLVALPAIPDVPAGADALTPLAFDVVTTRTVDGRTATERRRMTRTHDRVHVAEPEREWLFHRHTLDPRRVTALMVDHRSRSIVEHEESDVRNMLGITGWADVVTMGIDPGSIGALTRTIQRRSLADVSFVRYTAADTSSLQDVWWSSAQLLAAEYTVVDARGTMRVTLENVSAEPDLRVLENPAERWPRYEQADLAEWLERDR